MTEALAPEERFPLVLADPPYIPSGQTGVFPDDPLTAIDGGADGLDLARLCLEVGQRHLDVGGHLLIQLRDADQAERLVAEPGAADRLTAVETRSFGGHGAVLHLVGTLSRST
jgi:release factor glutamine methyltransferase